MTAAAIVIGAAVAIGALTGWLVATISRRRRDAEADRAAREATHGEFTGSLLIEPQGEEVAAGRGGVRMTPRGIDWMIPGGFKTGRGSVPWRQVESFARRGIAVRVGVSEAYGRTRIQYRGLGAPRMEGIARRYLPEPPWQRHARAPEGDACDALWSRRG